MDNTLTKRVMFSVEQPVIANVKDMAWPNAVFDLVSTSRLSIDARGCGAACDAAARRYRRIRVHCNASHAQTRVYPNDDDRS